jgi:hypothetical protein
VKFNVFALAGDIFTLEIGKYRGEFDNFHLGNSNSQLGNSNSHPGNWDSNPDFGDFLPANAVRLEKCSNPCIVRETPING